MTPISYKKKHKQKSKRSISLKFIPFHIPRIAFPRTRIKLGRKERSKGKKATKSAAHVTKHTDLNTIDISELDSAVIHGYGYRGAHNMSTIPSLIPRRIRFPVRFKFTLSLAHS